jgi:hypothetical protein
LEQSSDEEIEIITKSRKRVKFNDKVQIVYIERETILPGVSWMMVARDRKRFERRIREIEKTISWIFSSKHRLKIRKMIDLLMMTEKTEFIRITSTKRSVDNCNTNKNERSPHAAGDDAATARRAAAAGIGGDGGGGQQRTAAAAADSGGGGGQRRTAAAAGGGGGGGRRRRGAVSNGGDRRWNGSQNCINNDARRSLLHTENGDSTLPSVHHDR